MNKEKVIILLIRLVLVGVLTVIWDSLIPGIIAFTLWLIGDYNQGDKGDKGLGATG